MASLALPAAFDEQVNPFCHSVAVLVPGLDVDRETARLPGLQRHGLRTDRDARTVLVVLAGEVQPDLLSAWIVLGSPRMVIVGALRSPFGGATFRIGVPAEIFMPAPSR
jgi:hypothetical protein